MGRKLLHNYKKIYQEHLQGISIKELSKKFNAPIPSIYAHFKLKNFTYNKEISVRQTGFYVNEEYLNEINTEDKAYFLGWMFSDGNVNDKSICLKLIKDDVEIIEKLFSYFSSGYKTSFYKNNASISVTSKKLSDKLKELGCVENKTKIGFNLVEIPNNLYSHFIRGYFDGDGCISKRSARPNQRQISICSIDKEFLEQVSKKLEEFNIKSSICEEIRLGKSLKLPGGMSSTTCKNMFRLILTSHVDKLKFYEFIYKPCSIKLKRKYIVYNEYYVNTVLTLESKNPKAVQRIENEPLINYNLLTENTFKKGKEIDEDQIINLYLSNVCEYHIHKQTNVCRSIINRIIKEYNFSKSVRYPV